MQSRNAHKHRAPQVPWSSEKKGHTYFGWTPRTPLDTENSSGRHASERGAGLGVLIPRPAMFNIKHVSGEGI